MGTMKIVVSGDSIIMRDIGIQKDHETTSMLDIIRSADVAFTNLEVLPNNFQGDPALESGGTHLAAHPNVLDYLTNAGFNILGASNNHSLDYSISGLMHTMDELNKRSIPFAGVGENLASARMPAYLTTPSGTVSLLACSSTFGKGQEASAQRDNLQGRPGLSPLHVKTMHEVTSDQLTSLKQIATDLGIETERLDKVQMGFAFPPDDPETFSFLGKDFRAADSTRLVTTPNEKDVVDIEKWIREARHRSDVVMCSVHAHEAGLTKEEPADFLVEFAHRAIDAGADMVIGHGPHLLRGMEIYNGKPIFYSLGNFVGQNELVEKLPEDSYTSFRVESDMTPSAIFRLRTANDTKSFPAHAKYWQTVLPVCEFEENTLVSLRLVPISLGHGSKAYERGRPRMACPEETKVIIQTMQRLSTPFGTEIADDGTVSLSSNMRNNNTLMGTALTPSPKMCTKVKANHKAP